MTPWAAAHAAQQQQASFLNADRDKRIRIAKVASTAKNGLILALVGVPICCGPVALYGGALGYRATRLARAEGVPLPVTAIIAMITSALVTAAFCIGTVMFIRDQQAHADRLDAVKARLEGKREAAVLDPKTACDLVEEHLLQHGHGGKTIDFNKIDCDGALTVSDRRASAPDVRFAFGKVHSTVTACFERRSRWFLLKVRDSGTCAELPPPAPFTAPARQFTEDELAADEKKARDDLTKASGALALKAYLESLGKVKTDAARGGGAETVCAKADLARLVSVSERRTVATVDFGLLDGSGAWPFLTSEAIAKVMDDKGLPDERAKSAAATRSESGPLLVVYKAENRLWPVVNSKSEVAGKDFSYDGGEWSGWLMVYDVDSAARLCQTRLTFQSSNVVDFKKGHFASEKGSAKEAVERDFKDHFQTAAIAAIRRAAPDLRLGYKTLE